LGFKLNIETPSLKVRVGLKSVIDFELLDRISTLKVSSGTSRLKPIIGLQVESQLDLEFEIADRQTSRLTPIVPEQLGLKLKRGNSTAIRRFGQHQIRNCN